MFSTIDGNCRHSHHVNFCPSARTKTACRYGWRMGLHASNCQPTRQRHDFNINKISEYKCMKYECYPYHRLVRNDTCRYRKNDRKEGLTFC